MESSATKFPVLTAGRCVLGKYGYISTELKMQAEEL
jgi:hypothetical protein